MRKLTEFAIMFFVFAIAILGVIGYRFIHG